MSIFTQPLSEKDRQRELNWVDSLDADPEAKAMIRSIYEQDRVTILTMLTKAARIFMHLIARKITRR